jgi:hypothetical protein
MLAACAQQPDAEAASAGHAPADDATNDSVTQPLSGVVDSIFPIEEEIRRFRVGLPEVNALAGGASSRDQLVDRFLHAIEQADSAALTPLALTRPEFGWLYYPHTMYTRRPYELSPALVWFQMQNSTSSSLTRVFRSLAGRPLHATGYRCEEEPKREGPNVVWSECRVTLDPPGGEAANVRLFGSIVERDGVFKFVSYAAEL